MYPGAYGEYRNVSLADTSLSNPRIPRMSETRQALSNQQNHVSDTDGYEQSDLRAADSTPGTAIHIPSTRRKDSVGEGGYEAAKRPGSSSAPKESGIKRRMSSFMHKMGMSKTETSKMEMKARDVDVGSEGQGLDNGALDKEPVEEVEERVWLDEGGR